MVLLRYIVARSFEKCVFWLAPLSLSVVYVPLNSFPLVGSQSSERIISVNIGHPLWKMIQLNPSPRVLGVGIRAHFSISITYSEK